MEPWDGPASVAFTDGRVVGATLDRNGLRPGRWVETTDGYVVLGSESGLLDIPPEQVRRLGRLQPGKLFLVDLERGRIVEDEEVKREVATRQPYGEWFARNAVPFAELPPSEQVTLSDQPLHLRQRAFGYIAGGPARAARRRWRCDGAEPIGSMGNDLSLAVLSDQAPPLFSYFKQLFAQVTNPPIDPIREEIVMSLATSLGNERNLFEETPEHAHKLLLDQPILLNRELETLRHVDHDVYAARTIDITWPVAEGPAGMDRRDRAHLPPGARGDRRTASTSSSSPTAGSDPRASPIPSLLAVAAVHHHLVLEGTRLRAGIILESGEPREVHHFATLIGYGASAINPYLMLETLDELVAEGRIARDGADGTGALDAEEAAQNVVKAIGKGLLKTISKMGISTIQSYRGAQIFEAVGLERELIDRHFTGHRLAHRRRRRRRARDRGARAPRARLSRRPDGRDRCCRSAASTRGGATASTTCGTRRRSRSSSTPCARRTATWPRRSRVTRRRTRLCARARRSRSTASTRARSTRTPRARRRCAGCWRSGRGRVRGRPRSRSRRSSRRARSSSASAPAR